MESVCVMNWPDIDNAAELYRRGVLPLKAVAWAIARFRSQDNQPLTAADLMRHAGASKTAAYRVVAELRLAIDDQCQPISHSRISGPAEPGPDTVPFSRKPGIPDSRNAGKTVPETGNPPTPPYKATEKRKDTHIEPGFPTCGNRSCEPWERGAAVLRENLQTDPLASYLARNAHLPEVQALAEDTGEGRYPAGWRLESAALKFLSPRVPDDVRSCRDCRASLNYLLSIARGLREPYVPPSLANSGEPQATGAMAARRNGPDVMNLDLSRYE